MLRSIGPKKVRFLFSIFVFFWASQLWGQTHMIEKFEGIPSDPETQGMRNTVDDAVLEDEEPVPVGYSVTAFDTLTGDGPRLLVGVESLDEELVADFSVSLDLGPELAAAFTGAQPYYLTNPDAPWSLSVGLSGDIVTLSVHGVENPEYQGIHSLGPRGEIAELFFNPVSSGEYAIQIADGQVTNPDGSPANTAIYFKDDSFEVGEPRIKTGALPDGLAGKSYNHTLAFAHLALPLNLEVAAGSLPPGYFLFHHDIVGSPDQTGQAGTYSFTLRATDANGLVAEHTLSLTVKPSGPELVNALLVADNDGDGLVSEGDGLRLFFDESVVLGPQAEKALSLSAPGDSLGGNFSLALHQDYASWVEVTLGDDVSLKILSAWNDDNSAIQVLPFAGGIEDAEGVPAFSAAPVPIQLANEVDVNALFWVVGEEVGPLPFTPFAGIPTGISVDGLPPGVFLDGEAITGAPTDDAIEPGSENLYTVVVRHGLDVMATALIEVVPTDPTVSFGPVRDPDTRLPLESDTANFGAILSLDLVGASPTGPLPEVTLDGRPLSLAPGSDPDRLLAILPSTGETKTYRLEVSQDGKVSQPVGLFLDEVVAPPGVKGPYIDHTWFYTARDGQGYLLAVGLGLGSDSEYLLENNALAVVEADDYHALLVAPDDFEYFDFTRGFSLTVNRKDGESGGFLREPDEEVITYLDEYFNGNFIGDPNGVPGVLYEEGQQGGNQNDWKETVEAFCKELCMVIDETDAKASEEKKKRIKNFIKAIAAHESKLFKARVQCGGGPGVTYGQIEPETLRTILCNEDRKKAVKDMIVKCTGKTEKEVCEILDGFKKEKGNNWDGEYGMKLKEILSQGGKAGDKFAALLMRLYFKTKAGQSFDHGEYDNSKPEPGNPPTEKWVDCPNDPQGKDIRTCGDETGKWFYAEQWRKYYHGGTNRRPCVEWSEPDEHGKRTCTKYKSNSQWKDCREKLRKRFVENFCEYIRLLG